MNNNETPGAADGFLRLQTVDLSHTVSPRMPRWPKDPATIFEQWSAIGRDGYFLRRFSMGEHSGTHMVAPASYYPSGKTIEQYAARDLVRPAVVLDTQEECARDPDYTLTVYDLKRWESIYGPVPPGYVALLLTGWSDRWLDPAAYLGLDNDGGLHFPGFGYDAASVLLTERHVAGLGTDASGLEPGRDTTLSVSRLALSQPRIVLENLTNLAQLPATGAVLVVGPLKLAGGSGSPTSVMALLPQETK